jgi:hypothetical protein
MLGFLCFGRTGHIVNDQPGHIKLQAVLANGELKKGLRLFRSDAVHTNI